MLRNFVPSTNQIYQWEFPKVAVLKRSTKEAIWWAVLFVENPVFNPLSARYEEKCNA